MKEKRDQDGTKITDEDVLDYVRNVLVPELSILFSSISIGLKPSIEYTTIEPLGSDRPGRLSDVNAVLTDLSCNIDLNLDVCTKDTVGLLLDVTQIFRESGLPLMRAVVTTNGKRDFRCPQVIRWWNIETNLFDISGSVQLGEAEDQASEVCREIDGGSWGLPMASFLIRRISLVLPCGNLYGGPSNP
ncbi:hypothetical protein CRG98_017094 [Punica granatum]|uniref:ACT domain-containing protein ACR n=1 Tax=Punica granatum TaxID=22663 RepID=A0A2I0K2V4_PUNGR|nr:hypothetical protein CRG98_017094 [Punica granatum]